ncbi:MAG: hypothetical protein RSB41_00550 [Bacilli bacterium]
MKKLLIILTCFISFFSCSLNIHAIKNINIVNNSLVPLFDKSTYIYNVYVSEETSEVIIEGTKENEDEVITGTGKIKIEGNKTVAEISNGIEKYYINIFKNYKIENNKSDASLRFLSIKGYNIDFKSDVFDYKIEVKGYDDLEVIYVGGNENSKIVMSGNRNLLDKDNVIVISVKSEDKTNNNVYKIHVNVLSSAFKEEKEKSNFKKSFSKDDKIIVFSIVFSFSLILIFILYFIMFHKKKN